MGTYGCTDGAATSSVQSAANQGVLRGRLGLETAQVPQQDRHGLLWLERGQLYVHQGTLRFRTAGTESMPSGDYAIPYQLVTCLILEPGTSITHDVMRICASHGTGIVAVGSCATRFFASAPAHPGKSARARRHAIMWADESLRTRVARRMYAMRLGEVFPNADIAVLRGMEGARMKQMYQSLAQQYGISWKGRRYDRNHPSEADIPNQAINHVVTAVEATAMVAVAVTGAIPQLGFIHEDPGHSFTLDITDLFRDTITLPTAFSVAGQHERIRKDGIERVARKVTAVVLRRKRVVSLMIDRIKDLLDEGAKKDIGCEEAE